MAHFHGLENEVSTYSRGRRRVDFIFISQQIIPFVRHCGYEPFNEHIFSDHRLMFVDLDKSLFSTELISIKPPQLRGISSSDPHNSLLYV